MLRIGIAGCGRVARIHVGRMLARQCVAVVGCADPDAAAANSLAATIPVDHADGAVLSFTDHLALLNHTKPDALAIFSPHRTHYRLALDALQAGCHVFIEKPLSTNTQEAVDIVNLARGRNRKVGVGHQYRLRPTLIAAREQIRAGRLGRIRLVSASMTAPWLASHQGPADVWRLDPKVSGGGMLADTGDHLLDALLWTTGQTAVEVAAFQGRVDPGLDVVTAAAIRLSQGTFATLGLSAVAPGPLFELTYHGELGRLRVTESTLAADAGPATAFPDPDQTIDGNFVAAITEDSLLSCPASEALDTVRLYEAIARSAATGEIVRLT